MSTPNEFNSVFENDTQPKPIHCLAFLHTLQPMLDGTWLAHGNRKGVSKREHEHEQHEQYDNWGDGCGQGQTKPKNESIDRVKALLLWSSSC